MYGLPIYPNDKKTVTERLDWATEHIEGLVGRERFHQFFAVHEIEAWLLSQPDIFPRDVQTTLPKSIKPPERINFDKPPGSLLNSLYKQATRKGYKKFVNGPALFEKLDPSVAYAKCPHLKRLLHTMLELAKNSGL